MVASNKILIILFAYPKFNVMSKNLSSTITCGHCGNISPMEIIGTADTSTSYYSPEGYEMGESGDVYNILKCPSCNKVNIATYFWHDGMDTSEEVVYNILYPNQVDTPKGLPSHIASSINAAEKIKNIDVNAYAILLRRTLEQVCLDSEAKSGTLAAMLKELADRHEIPNKLVDVAKGLKDFGNIGAHAGIGELSEKEIPIVRALTFAILEYMYTAPHLATLAETKLASIKMKSKS